METLGKDSEYANPFLIDNKNAFKSVVIFFKLETA